MVSHYRSTGLPHFGKLMQTDEVVALLGMRRLSSHCGWIIYTIQAARKARRLAADIGNPIVFIL
jgi:hypothetical protein